LEYLFWISTLLPGLAVVRLFYPRYLRRGLLGSQAAGFVFSLAMLMPLTVCAYSLHLRVETVAVAYLAILLASAAILVFHRLRRRERIYPLQTLRFPLTSITLLAVLCTLPMGGAATYDHPMHAAKVLELRTFGFTLQDPLSPLPVIESKFHVNSIHLLHAVGSYLTQQEPFDFWYRSARFFRLLTLGGVEFLAWSIFRSGWLGATAVLASVPLLAQTGAAVPAIVAGVVLYAVVLVVAAEALREPLRRDYVGVFLASVALATVHVGEWVVFLLCVLPPLLFIGYLFTTLRGSSWAGALVTTSLLVPGIPFVLLTAIQPNHGMEQMAELFTWVTHRYSFWGYTLRTVPLSTLRWILPVALMLAWSAYAKPRNLSLLVSAGAVLTAIVWMFNPLAFELLARIFPYWMIGRADNVIKIVGCATVPATLAWFGRRTIARRGTRLVIPIIICGAALAASLPTIQAERNRAKMEQSAIIQAGELREVLQPLVRPRELVAAEGHTSLAISAVVPVAVMAPDLGNANPADPGVKQRWLDCVELLASSTTAARRLQIIEHYRISYLVTRTDTSTPPYATRTDTSTPPPDLDAIADLVASGRWFRVYKVKHALLAR